MLSAEFTVQKMKFSIKNFFSKCDQIRRKMQTWSHLLKKSLMKNFIFLHSDSKTALKKHRWILLKERLQQGPQWEKQTHISTRNSHRRATSCCCIYNTKLAFVSQVPMWVLCKSPQIIWSTRSKCETAPSKWKPWKIL